MIIVVKTNDQVVFDDMAEGTIFRIDYEGSQPVYAMKVPKMCEPCSKDPANAIDMHDASWFWVDGYETVTIFDSVKLIIE